MERTWNDHAWLLGQQHISKNTIIVVYSINAFWFNMFSYSFQYHEKHFMFTWETRERQVIWFISSPDKKLIIAS